MTAKQKFSATHCTISAIIISIVIMIAICAKPEPEILPVADLQRKLNELGFPCPVDGICGAKTHAARLAYEKAEINKSADYWYIKFGGQNE